MPFESVNKPGNGHLSHGGMDLTTGSIPKNLLIFSLPMLAGSVLQTAYSLVNAFWVGKYLGTNALAAVTVSFPAIFVLVALGAGLTIATNILIAQYVGAREWEKLKDVVQTSIIVVVFLSMAFLALGLGYASVILRVVGTPADVFPIALGYIRIYFWTLPFGFGIFLIGAMLRGIGDSRTPLYFQAGAVVLNAMLDPLLIFGVAGFPKLGLNGTAFASIIVQALAVARVDHLHTFLPAAGQPGPYPAPHQPAYRMAAGADRVSGHDPAVRGVSQHVFHRAFCQRVRRGRGRGFWSGASD